ncbi:hypothetical protein B0T10DRAFT_30223 [Thelonectria olida]|uniref:Uncharacterized protein n=1 Tax=Thelonectria olida TaxID=1576542 RepID=A0A9P8WI67_9HYPO|nr:hypothetical protein B0T10DRAFT_30223 [Thelonectria olida]
MTGLSFRRFLSPSRSRSKDKDLDWADVWAEDGTHPTKMADQKKQRSRSWIPTTRRKNSSTEPADVRRARTSHRAELSLPQISFDQPCSSTYSLPTRQEAKRDVFAGTPSSDMKAASSLCLPEQTQRLRHSLSPTQQPKPSNEIVSPPNLDISFNHTRSKPSLSLSIPRVSQSDNQSTRSLAPPNNKESPTGSMSTVEHLILQTDEAFKAVGVALKDAKPTQQTHQCSPNYTPPASRLVARKHQASMPLPLRYTKDQRLRDIPSPLASPVRKASVMKPKPRRKKSTKRPTFRGTPPRRPQMRGPRSWTLPENVTEILTGQRFKRIEADEMLTPERLEMLNRRREQQAQLEEETKKASRESCDSSHDEGRSLLSENSETPIEPFHLEDLASRIGASGVEVKTFLEEPSPCTPPHEDAVCQDFTLEKGSEGGEIYLKPLTYNPKGETATVTELTASLPLPPKNPARLEAPLKKPLPSIPEVVLTTPDNKEPTPLVKQWKQRRQAQRLLQAEEKDGIVYIHSTPFTLTTPLFRHGPITFSKAELCQGVKVMDDTLDWTAFQMAILCGAGDLFPDMTWEEDIKQVSDITAWFDSFGFESCGKLVPEDVPALSSAESFRSTVSLSPSTVDMDTELPIPVASEYPSGFWNSPLPNASLDREKFFSNQGLKRWAGEGHPKPYIQRNSIDSGPPSPMLPLVIRAGGLEGDDPVPMGYNLHHDLGEFLRWEAENVYATGYCGTP